jgi:enoyl-CoA hydratase/carnithine racemase
LSWEVSVSGEESVVTVNRQGAVARVAVGKGDRANALGTSGWQELAARMGELAGDDALGAVVVTGSGGSSFSSGSQLTEWIGAQDDEVDASFVAMEEALSAVERVPVPVIAEVRGAALGAGCQLACACDLRIVGRHAKLGMPVARWGILVPPVFAARLALVTGSAAARDLLFTGRIVGGEEALRLGLASLCVAEGDLDRETTAVVEAILAHPLPAVRAAKSAVDALVSADRERLRGLPSGPAADYQSLQSGLIASPWSREPAS